MISLDFSRIPEPANLVLRYFTLEVAKIIPDSIIGVYVTGSVAAGDFHPAKSDLDVVILLDDLPDELVFKKLQEIHRITEQRYSKPRLNGYYIDFIALQKMSSETAPIIPSFYNGAISLTKPAILNKIDLLELKTNSITVGGFSTSLLVNNLSASEVTKQLYENINSYWVQWIRQHTGFWGRVKLCLFPWLTEWGILGVARQLYTLHTGLVASKVKAGFYINRTLSAEYNHITEIAINIRKKNKSIYYVQPSFYRAKMTIKCMRYIISVFNSYYNSLENKSLLN